MQEAPKIPEKSPLRDMLVDMFQELDAMFQNNVDKHLDERDNLVALLHRLKTFCKTHNQELSNVFPKWSQKSYETVVYHQTKLLVATRKMKDRKALPKHAEHRAKAYEALRQIITYLRQIVG